MNPYDLYAPWYDTQNPMDDLSFYLEELEHFGGPILDIGCGTGRLFIPFAREGYTVTGFDTSQPMLDLARHKLLQESAEVQKRITLSYADMKQFQFLPLYRSIIFGCNTFQHLLENDEQDQCLKRVHAHLHSEGALYIQGTCVQWKEHDADVLYYRGRQWHEETKSWIDISYSFHYDTLRQIQYLHLFLDILGEDQLLKRQKIVLKLRYFYPPELERILWSNGFILDELWGDFERNPLTPTSTWIIARAKKK